MNSILFQYHKTPYGELKLASYEDKLCMCDWRYRKMREQIDKRVGEQLKAAFVEGNSAVIEAAQQQLQEYFTKKREDFDIPLLLAGSEFQQSVWEELLKIPYGQTETYLGLSGRLGDVKAIRAVAAANGANALSIIVPCHRIVGSDGKMTGYAGGTNTKRKLLELEGARQKELLLFED
jgi:methylated-DNA-[protein]-cysteine S-methyltransferase